MKPLNAYLTTLILIAAGTLTAAAELKLGAELLPRSTPIGEPVEFQLLVQGNDRSGTPKINTDSSITVKPGGTQTRVNIVNGRRTSNLIYNYLLYPSKLGEFSVEAEVPIEGDALLTNPITFTVREKTLQEKQREPFLKLATDARNVYVGQSVPVEVTLFISEASRFRSTRTHPELQTSDFVPEAFVGPLYGDAKVPSYEPFDYTTRVTAIKPGKTTLGPATLQAIIDVPFGQRMMRKQYDLKSDPLEIEVKPLPTEGKPVSFKGAVGSFRMTMDAEPLTLTQGDPISITLEIEGDGSFKTVEMPEIADRKGWKLYPSRKFENNDRRTGQTTGLTFTQMLVPLSMQDEIPPFEFSFFDPHGEKYVTLKTDAIPIEVTASPASLPVTSSDGQTVTPAAPITPDASVPVADMNDILGIRPMADFGMTAPPVPVYRTKAFWVAQTMPLGAFALMFLFFIREKRRERAPKKRKSSVPEFADQLQKLQSSSAAGAAKFYQLASSALDSWEYHAGHTVASLHDRELDQKIHAIRERYGVLRFGSDSDASDPVDADERRNVIATLKSLLEHAPVF